MRPRIAHLTLAVLLCAVSFISADGQKIRTSPSDRCEWSEVPHAAKLRKLHLVRPDLIPYPIMFEVYC